LKKKRSLTNFAFLNFPKAYQNKQGFTNTQANSVLGLQTISLIKTEIPLGSNVNQSIIIIPNELNLGMGNKIWLYTVNFYDNYGRVIQTYKTNHLGGYDIITNQYDFAGKILFTLHEHTPDKIKFTAIRTAFTYDQQGRLLTTSEQIGENTQSVVVSSLTYNRLGQVESNAIHKKKDNTFVQTVDYKYNINGQLTDINDINTPGSRLFREQITYLSNSNIETTTWSTSKKPTKIKYTYSYDGANRLLKAVSTGNKYDMSFTYDNYNRITNLIRTGSYPLSNGTLLYADIDNLTYTYTGFKPLTVTDNATVSPKKYGFNDCNITGNDYLYDNNGNMTLDKNKNIIISYNIMDLTSVISYGAGKYTKTFYTTSGQKLRVEEWLNGLSAKCTDYIGAFVYENNKLAYIINSTGRIVITQSTTKAVTPPIPPNPYFSYIREYYIKDHLGNVCVTFNQNGVVLQETAYYPFGMQIESLAYNAAPPAGYTTNKNQYQYTNHESQSTGFIDYGFRQFDPILCTWHSPDKLVEITPGENPYAYCGNDPINKYDVMGLYSQFKSRNEELRFQRAWGSTMAKMNSFCNDGSSRFSDIGLDFNDLFTDVTGNRDFVRNSDISFHFDSSNGEMRSNGVKGFYTSINNNLRILSLDGIGTWNFEGKVSVNQLNSMLSSTNFHGVPLYELPFLDQGFYLYGIGIFVKSAKNAINVQHEYGHYLQGGRYGPNYYVYGADVSVGNSIYGMISGDKKSHSTLYFEKEANSMANYYLGTESAFPKNAMNKGFNYYPYDPNWKPTEVIIYQNIMNNYNNLSNQFNNLSNQFNSLFNINTWIKY